MTLRLGVVADIHHGVDEVIKKGTTSLPLLQQALEMAKSAAVDAVIDLGDRISDASPATDAALACDVGRIFVRSGLERRHVCGNHDRACLSAAANAAALQAETGSRVREVAGLRIILWQPEVTAVLPWPPRRRFPLRPLPPFATMRGDPIAALRAQVQSGRLP